MTQLGKLPTRYRFFLNPYQDVRFTRCPQCTHLTRQHKLPLFIHVDPMHPVLLNKTCRYCPTCDLLIALLAQSLGLEVRAIQVARHTRRRGPANRYLRESILVMQKTR